METKKLLFELIQAMVAKKDEVKVSETIGETIHVLSIKVDKSDIGKVIGKEGTTSKALTKIFATIGADQGIKHILDIVTE
jgi:predicted RNA-binding protein YlqC (UPF0109 family)